MSKWIRKGDRVCVIAGNDKGQFGEVLSRSGSRVIIQGVNIRKKHAKRTQEAQKAQILEMEMPIDISNVSICDNDGKPVKIKAKKKEDGTRDLVYNDKNKEVVFRSIKQKA